MARRESNFVGQQFFNPIQYPLPPTSTLGLPMTYNPSVVGQPNIGQPGTLTGIQPLTGQSPVTYPASNVGALPTGNDAIEWMNDTSYVSPPVETEWITSNYSPVGYTQPIDTSYVSPGTTLDGKPIPPTPPEGYTQPIDTTGMTENPFGFTNYEGYEFPWYESPYGLTLRWEDVPMGVNIYEILDKYNVPYQIRDEGITTRQGYFPSGFSESHIDTGADWYNKWMENEQLRLKKEAIEERQEFIGRYYMPNWYMDLVSWRGW